MIRKFPGKQKYGLYSLKTHKRLGTFPSRVAALRRERQIQYFKRQKR
jgi:hypothetical protein